MSIHDIPIYQYHHARALYLCFDSSIAALLQTVYIPTYIIISDAVSFDL